MLRIRYHIRWKLLLSGMAVVFVATAISRLIAPQLAVWLSASFSELGAYQLALFLDSLISCLLFAVLAAVLMFISSENLVNRILELSTAVRSIATGNFDVNVVGDIDRHDEVFQLASDIRLMAHELKRNEYLRKDFISNVSHEIKTPLSIISGYAKLLSDSGSVDADGQEYLGVIRRESERLLKMSTNMLSISRLERQDGFLEKTSFYLDEQLRQIALFLEPRWSARGVSMEADLESIHFYGNEELLGQVWFNLLDNAIKFTDAGGQVRVAAASSGGSVYVTVSDDGIGMDQETKERLFEQFYQGDRSRSKDGFGLGLPLVKRIVELHGGRITVESQPGAGTSVTVTLPQRQV